MSASENDRLVMTESTRREIRELGIEPPQSVDGRPIDVVPDSDAREMLLVCMRADRPGYFEDDVIADCDRCACEVRHRPHVPIGAIPICAQCFSIERAREGKPGLDQLLSG